MIDESIDPIFLLNNRLWPNSAHVIYNIGKNIDLRHSKIVFGQFLVLLNMVQKSNHNLLLIVLALKGMISLPGSRHSHHSYAYQNPNNSKNNQKLDQR